MRDKGNNHRMIQLEVQYWCLSPAWPSLKTPVTIRGTGELHVTNSVQPVLRSYDTERLFILCNISNTWNDCYWGPHKTQQQRGLEECCVREELDKVSKRAAVIPVLSTSSLSGKRHVWSSPSGAAFCSRVPARWIDHCECSLVVIGYSRSNVRKSGHQEATFTWFIPLGAGHWIFPLSSSIPGVHVVQLG